MSSPDPTTTYDEQDPEKEPDVDDVDDVDDVKEGPDGPEDLPDGSPVPANYNVSYLY